MFMVALHHAEQCWFYPHWRKDCDVSRPEYTGLYGELHNVDGLNEETIEGWQDWTAQDRPSKAFLDQWRSGKRGAKRIDADTPAHIFKRC